jgi:ABC-type transport system involved in cytochrome c biogenesis permease subunit
MVSELFWSVIVIYTLAVLLYLFYSVFSQRSLSKGGFFLLILGLALHSVILFPFLFSQGYPYLMNQSNAFQLIAWVCVVLFLILRYSFRLEGAGVFFAPAALIFLILSAFYEGSYHLAIKVMSSPWAMIHLFLVFIAFAIFLASIVVGIIFMMMESQVKQKRLRPFYQRFPSLETLDRIHYRALTIGFTLLSLGILAGSLLSKDINGVYFTGDPKQLWVLGMWGFYAVLLNSRIQAGWRGRRGILLSIIGFISFIILVLVFLGLRQPF